MESFSPTAALHGRTFTACLHARFHEKNKHIYLVLNLFVMYSYAVRRLAVACVFARPPPPHTCCLPVSMNISCSPHSPSIKGETTPFCLCLLLPLLTTRALKMTEVDWIHYIHIETSSPCAQQPRKLGDVNCMFATSALERYLQDLHRKQIAMIS